MRLVIGILIGMIVGVIIAYLLLGFVPIKADWANVAVTFFGAVASLIVAFIALFWPSIQHGLYSDRLVLRLRSKKTSMELIGVEHVRYVHLLVSNRHVAYPVENVRVYVELIQYPDRQPAHDNFSTGLLPIHWQFERPTGQQGVEHPDLPLAHTIGRDRLCDLGRLVLEQNQFILETAYEVADCPRTFGPNQSIVLQLRAFGDNAFSKPLILKMHWNGKWCEDDAEMMNNLQINEVSPSKVR